MLNYQLEDLITGDKLVRYHLLGGGVLALSHTGSRGAALRLRSVTGGQGSLTGVGILQTWL